MTTPADHVRRYYATFDEAGRLGSPEGALELRRTLAVLDRHLPPASRVLDLGGGPGRYAAELVERGHRVVLADLSPEQLALAREELGDHPAVESIDEVDARDLGRYGDGSFDAVLALGPFYHLTTDADRERAARETHRVLRAGGTAFVAFIPRTAGVLGLLERAARDASQVTADVLRTAAATGAFHNASPAGFQEGYYPQPEELVSLLEGAGFERLDTLSLKSIAHGRAAEVASLAPPLQAAVEELVDSLARRPEVVATCGHALAVAKKR